MRPNPLCVSFAAMLLAACQMTSNDAGTAKGQAKARSTGKSAAKGGREPITIAEGTALPLVLETGVSSATNKPGDMVVARLASEVRSGERVLLPQGTEVRGKVTAAIASGRVKGRARLALSFDTLVLKGKEYAVETKMVDVTAPDSHKRDAAIVGGGAAAGGIIGAIAGGKKGAGIGVLVGAGAGGGTVLATKGKEVSLPAGTRWTARLTREARLD